MGKENTEVATEMEDILGFKKEEENIVDDKTISDDKKPDDKKEETPPAPVTKTTPVTDEQISINQEIAKIDVKITELEKETVDTDDFYANIEAELSEDEQALEFSDKPAYMKLVNAKAKEYETKHSKATEIQSLKDTKKEMESVYARQSAIVEVSTEFPEYDHEKVLSFFNDDLTKNQQQAIYDESTSYTDVYKKAYQKYVESNPKNIKQTPAPAIPDVNNVTKVVPSDNDTDDGLKSEDQQLRDAMGL